MKKLLYTIFIRLLMVAVVLALFASPPFPYTVYASAVTDSVRFTASYVSGNTGTKTVYYILDSGSSQQLGTVSSSSGLDVTFNATYTNSIRVYVQISDDAIYNEHLYINGNLKSSGNVGNSGVSYSRGDTTPPTGRIVSPVSGSTITKCPLIIMANVSDDESGVQWVIYTVKYDGLWHQIGTDDSSSGESGWSTYWDCSNVANQPVELAISAMDNAGNQGNYLGGVFDVTLAKGQSTLQPGSTAASSLTPTFTTVPPTNTMTPVPTSTQAAPTVTQAPTQTTQPSPTTTASQTPGSTVSPVPTATIQVLTPAKKPITIQIPTCSAVVAPLLVGFSFMIWKKRSTIRDHPIKSRRNIK